MSASKVSDIHLIGLAADRPTADSSNNGYYYTATDTNGGTTYRSNGSSWVQVAGPVTASGTGGSAGGDLTGTYPNPTIASGAVTEAKMTTADNTTNNVTSSKHGFAPKSPADATQFLNGAATAAFAAVKDSDLSTSDITTNNVTSTKHGFAPKSPADATQFLNGAATADFAAVKDSDLSTSDITTNNSSTSKHGFLKKLDNTATHYMDGTGAWSTPAGSGGTIGGSTGSTDNAIIRADGTGGATLKSSIATIDDSGTVNIPTGQTYNINGSPHSHGGSGASITEGAYASAPGSPTDNDLYFATDTGVVLHRASSAWVPWGPLPKLTLPLAVTGAATTLNNGGTMNSGDTSCTITSATGFPAAPFFITIESETIRVGARSGTALSSLTRGYNGSSAANHSDGTAVTLKNWIWANQGTSTVDQSYGPTIMQSQVNAGQTLRALYCNAPATPYTVTALVYKENVEHLNYLGCGIGFRENSSGKFIFFGPEEADGTFYMGVMRWASTTSYTTPSKTSVATGVRDRYWLQISDDGTTIYFKASTSGLPGTYTTFYSNTRGYYFSTAPDGLAMCLYQENGSIQSTASFWSWVVT